MKKELVPFDVLLITSLVLSMILVGYNAFSVPVIPPPTATYTQNTTTATEAPTRSLYPTVEEVLHEYSININNADLEKLTQLPGIGVVLAGRIIDYRNEHGPFGSLDELTNVKGIGEKTLEKLRDYAYVE